MKKLMVPLCAALMACVCVAADQTAKPAVAAGARARARASRPMMMHGLRNANVRPFGKLADGTEVKLYRLRGMGGLTLDITDFGGRLVRCYAPDKYGNLADVTLGWNTPAEYEKWGHSMGTLIGRFGNRIKDGKFSIDGKEYQLACNEDCKKPHTTRHCNLHSGPKGWDSKVWKVRPFRQGFVQGLELSIVSPDGDMGFPGTVTCKVTYKVLPNNTWTIDYEATTDKPTVLNLTHHTYWNMAGESSGNVLNQELQINADEYTQTDIGLIPTKNAPVKGTGMDFTTLRPIGAKMDLMKAEKAFAPMDNWYDHNFVLRGKNGELKQACIMRDPASGRTMEIWTTEPCMQMYGAQNFEPTEPAKAAGKNLCQFAGMALETQHYPDSPNRPDFPTTLLKPGETYKSHTEYRFSAK